MHLCDASVHVDSDGALAAVAADGVGLHNVAGSYDAAGS